MAFVSLSLFRRRSVVGSSHLRSANRRLLLEALEDRTVPTLLGNQLFPSDNPWNQRITNAPVAANSAAVLNNITTLYGNGRLHPDFGQASVTSGADLYGIPVNVVHGNSAPKVRFVIDAYAAESDILDVPMPANVVLEGDYQNGPKVGVNARGDSHLLIFDVDNNVGYELYRASRPSENADGRWHADQESVWDMKTNTFRTAGWTSADAAGLAILPGLVRPDEALPVSQGGQGVINHAIRFTLRNNLILNQYVYPASHTANPGNNNAAVQPPMGARFRLKAGVDISQLNPQSQVIAQAMKDYGMILADNGSNFFFSGASYSVDASNQFALTFNDSDIQDSTRGLKSLRYSDFEMVDLKPIVVGLSPASGSAGAQVTITGQNFGGGAGLTRVYFGAVASTSVRVVSDTQIVATAPAGVTGTVDVTVRSGYGTSATTAADRFTYGTTPPPAPAATRFQVVAPASATAGGNFTVTVKALDANNQVVPGYAGTVHFTSTDGGATLPADYTFTAADAGVHSFTVRLATAGSQTITATATAGGLTGSAAVSVTAVAPKATQFRVVPSVSTTVAGVPLSVTVTALDAAGNVVTGYAGTVAFSSPDWRATLPAAYTFTAADRGTHTFPVTLRIAGLQPVKVSDPANQIYSTARVTVTPAAFAAFQVILPSRVRAGAAFAVTVRATDAFGNVVTGYQGSVRFSSTDPQATLPGAYRFTAADGGAHTFTVTFRSKGWRSLSVFDTTSASLTGSNGTTVV